MSGNLLKQRKIAFFNAIKCEKTAKIYNEFMKKVKIFITRKFKEKNDTTGHRRTEKKSKPTLTS